MLTFILGFGAGLEWCFGLALTHNLQREYGPCHTVCTMEAPRNTDTVKVNPSRQNEINLVPMLRPGMTPRYLVLILQGKEGVCYCKITDGAEL